MDFALQVIQMIFYIVGILFMVCFMFIGIWGFIVFLRMYKNQRVQNYLIDKLNKNISSLSTSSKEEVIDSLDIDLDDSIFDTDNLDSSSNIIKIENA